MPLRVIHAQRQITYTENPNEVNLNIFFATGNYRSALRNVELGVILSKNHLRDKFPRMRDESVTLHHFGYLLTVAVAAGERKTRANKARNGLHRVYLVLNLSRKIMQTIDTYEVMVIIAEQLITNPNFKSLYAYFRVSCLGSFQFGNH